MSPIPSVALRYLYGGVVQYRPGDRLAPRVLPDFELVLIIEGTSTYRVDGTTHVATPGNVILARPGFHEVYVWDPAFLTRHAYLHFDLSALPTDWPPLASWPIIHREPDAVIAPMFRHLVQRVATHPEWPALGPGPDEIAILDCLLRILLRPIGASDSSASSQFPPPVHHALNHLRHVIDTDPHASLELAELARRAGVSDKHLCRLFRSALGHSPMKTFRLLKLQLALALLGRSNLAIQEIADRCGFGNPLYFTRVFTQTYGAAPSAVRRSLLRREPPPTNPLPPEITPRIYW